MVFDKTGTLTEGVPHVGAVYTCNGYTENDVLTLAAAHVILMDQSLNQLDTLFEIAHGLDTNTKQILGAVLAPAAICLSGALFFGFTQITSILLNLVSLGFGVTTAMLPMRKNNVLQDTTNRHFNAQVTFDPDVEH